MEFPGVNGYKKKPAAESNWPICKQRIAGPNPAVGSRSVRFPLMLTLPRMNELTVPRSSLP